MHIYNYVQTHIIIHQGVSVNPVAHNKITIIIKHLYKNVW
jgi:hypothetical protein